MKLKVVSVIEILLNISGDQFSRQLGSQVWGCREKNEEEKEVIVTVFESNANALHLKLAC